MPRPFSQFDLALKFKSINQALYIVLKSDFHAARSMTDRNPQHRYLDREILKFQPRSLSRIWIFKVKPDLRVNKIVWGLFFFAKYTFEALQLAAIRFNDFFSQHLGMSAFSPRSNFCTRSFSCFSLRKSQKKLSRAITSAWKILIE